MHNRKGLLIWDVESKPDSDIQYTILWRSLDERNNPNLISIHKLVEKNYKSLRARYLAWFYELGKEKFNEESIINFYDQNSIHNELLEECDELYEITKDIINKSLITP